MIVTNLNLVRGAVTKKTANIDMAARMARNEMMMAMVQLAKKEIKGRRPEGQRAEAGKPPMNRTGNLRRSIKGVPAKVCFAKYTAIVGPTMIYSRAVELGGIYAPRSWQGTSAMQGFPYMKPAYEKFVHSALANKIMYKHLGRLL
jgi:hypothetical protein